MFWLLLTGVLIPTVLVALVLTRERYLPWLNRHRPGIFLFLGIGELAVGMAYVVRGVNGPGRWFRVLWSLFLAACFVWISSRERREAERHDGSAA